MVPSAERGGKSGLAMIQRTTLSRPDNLSWYAVQIQSRLGNIASATLRGKGYEEFLPLYRSRRRWSDRIKELELPLFPGYLFCRCDVSDRLMPILTTPGVIGIVGAGKTPVPVDDEEIEAVRAVLRSGLAAQPWPCLRVGSKVYIEGGPLAGVEGIITKMDKVYRLIVSVNLLQRSVAVEIDHEWARPIADGIGPRAVTLSERTRFSKGETHLLGFRRRDIEEERRIVQ
jgi:transcription antitermination factor NusG